MSEPRAEELSPVRRQASSEKSTGMKGLGAGSTVRRMDEDVLAELLAYRQLLGREIQHHRLALDERKRQYVRLEAVLRDKCDHEWTQDDIEVGVESYMARVTYCAKCETTAL